MVPVSFLKILPKPVASANPRERAMSVTDWALLRRRLWAFVILRLLR